MNFAVIGDSNFRDLFSQHRDEIAAESGHTVEFMLASTVASVRTILDNPDYKPDVVFIGSPTNEIALKSKNNTKSREGIIESVIKDLFNCINDQANKNDSTYYVVCPPFLRLDPPWLEAKIPFYKTFIKTTHANTSHGNVFVGGEFEIGPEDLKGDGVHLTDSGMIKLRTRTIDDIKVAKEMRSNAGDIDDPEEEMDTAPLSSLARSTKKTPMRKKRMIEESSEEEGRITRKKKAKEDKLDAVLKMVQDLHNNRASNRARFDLIDDKMKESSVVQAELKEQIEHIKHGDNSFSAGIKEDLDAVENSSLRDTVIVKKLATDKTLPTDRKELSALILETGKEILTEIMGNNTCMKYIAPLYFRNEKRTLKEGERNEFPPFKITFKHLPDAIDFREKVIAASKIPTHRLYKTYVSNQQNVGTRICLMLLWGIVDILKKEKKESWVNQSAPKPTLQVKQTGTIIKTYSYIEAMSSYGERIEQKVLDEATKLASRFFYGQVEKIFIILKD